MSYIIGDRVVYNRQRKTGSHWVLDAIEKSGLKIENVGFPHECARGLSSFCFVRNPLTWYQSYHYMLGNKANRKAESVHFRMARLWKPKIDDFVRIVYRKGKRGRRFLFESYLEYLSPGPGEVCFVGKQEFLADHLMFILRSFGLEFDEDALRSVGRCNVSRVKSKLSSRSREMIEEMDSEILRMFYPGTSFGDDQVFVFRGK